MISANAYYGMTSANLPNADTNCCWSVCTSTCICITSTSLIFFRPNLAYSRSMMVWIAKIKRCNNNFYICGNLANDGTFSWNMVTFFIIYVTYPLALISFLLVFNLLIISTTPYMGQIAKHNRCNVTCTTDLMVCSIMFACCSCVWARRIGISGELDAITAR